MKKNNIHPKFYVTTPIYYINDVPHVGHAYCTIAADVIARYYREKLGKENVLFVTGTDENSQKTIEAAEKANQTVEEYSEQTAKKWQNIFNALNISYDRFIRTTDPDHVSVVQDILQKVFDNGDIYKGVYEGLYCVGHEAFIKESDLVDGVCPDHKTAPDHIKEENYFFKLSKYQDQLKQYILDNPDFIQPKSRRNEVLAFVERGLEDFSISRESQTWGIKLPFDHEHVAYVWFDALINYVTAAGYGTDSFEKWWPANLHLVGKDITKFHCMYWPAMLWSAGLALPNRVFAHGFLTIDGIKISKTIGNVINPIDLSDKYGNEALRYFLLREMPFGSDGDFSFERLKVVYETELGNKLGNLVSRVATMITKYSDGKFDVTTAAIPLEDLDQHMSDCQFDKYLEILFGRLSALNGAIEENKPWELVKTNPQKTTEFLSSLACEIVAIAIALKPFLPDTADKIIKTFADGKVRSDVGILFPRIEE